MLLQTWSIVNSKDEDDDEGVQISGFGEDRLTERMKDASVSAFQILLKFAARKILTRILHKEVII